MYALVVSYSMFWNNHNGSPIDSYVSDILFLIDLIIDNVYNVWSNTDIVISAVLWHTWSGDWKGIQP